MRKPGRNRAELIWVLAGFVAVQLGVGLGVDQLAGPIRDPEFAHLLQELRARQAEEPSRPLVLVLGSSRMQMALRAGRLASKSGPFVFNFALPGSGPMMQQIALRRLLACGVRPDLAVLEATPLSFSRRGGAPLEERLLDPARLDGQEAIRLHPYYHQPYKLWVRWLAARILPSYRHQAELRDELTLDVDKIKEEPAEQVDGYGWLEEEPWPSKRVEEKTAFALDQYGKALRDSVVGEGPAAAFRSLVELCRHESIRVVIVVPPESSRFRAAYRESPMENHVKPLAEGLGIPFFDARRWVDDEGFLDGHHLSRIGADQFTDRFRREIPVFSNASLKR